MSEENNVEIKKLVMHILDTSLHMPVLSVREHPEDEEIEDYIEKHILKALKDDNLKTASFQDGYNRVRELCTSMVYNEEEFIASSHEIAGILFDIMQKNIDIPTGDLVCCLFELDGVAHLGILKFNYRPSYIHYVQASQEGNVNSIIKQKTALPVETQKLDECAIISLRDLGIKLLEKKYDVNGEKEFYFSNIFLNCSSEVSDKQKVKLFKKATEDFNKKYFDDDHNVSAELKRAAAESIERNDAIDIVGVAETVFSQNPEIKTAYIEHVEKSGLKDRTISANDGVIEKNFSKQKLKTDTGIEISIPVGYYKDAGKIEFINNPDGTISILIKNVVRLTDA
jgi:hypothetical protein